MMSPGPWQAHPGLLGLGRVAKQPQQLAKVLGCIQGRPLPELLRGGLG